jgi:ABC-type transport system involved in cytochrome c biogenesis permease component
VRILYVLLGLILLPIILPLVIVAAAVFLPFLELDPETQQWLKFRDKRVGAIHVGDTYVYLR